MDGSASFGYWVRRRRKALDLTQDALARQVGCAETTIRKIEADSRPALALDRRVPGGSHRQAGGLSPRGAGRTGSRSLPRAYTRHSETTRPPPVTHASGRPAAQSAGPADRADRSRA
jgi:transcriptional regulator with XRE-family HTH domain